VAAGTPLGLEGDVGIAGGPHVHFEVAVPNFVRVDATTADWFDNAGFLVGDGVTDDVDGDGSDDVNRQNRIPVFCEFGFATPGDVNAAADCDDGCASGTFQPGGAVAAGTIFFRQATTTIANGDRSYVVRPNAGASLRAGTRITLSPGFRARTNSYFSASIGACDSPGGS
jgi:murein DD-endopeptidase MepM/ murein hydrolase activator NlpD